MGQRENAIHKSLSRVMFLSFIIIFDRKYFTSWISFATFVYKTSASELPDYALHRDGSFDAKHGDKTFYGPFYAILPAWLFVKHLADWPSR